MWSAIADFLIKCVAGLALWWAGVQSATTERLKANEAARKERDAKEREVSQLGDVDLLRRKSRWLRRTGE